MSACRWRSVVVAATLLTQVRAVAAQRAPAHHGTAPRAVRVCGGGDVSLGTNVDTSWAPVVARKLRRPVAALPDADSLVAPLRALMTGADVALLNVEGAIGEGEAATKCTARSVACFALRQPVAAAAALRSVLESGEVVGNLANNHARDAGVEGLARTSEHLSAAGVHVTGVDTLATEVVTVRGDTVAFLGFSTSSVPDARDLAAVRRHVGRAASRYRRLVVTMHLGAEGSAAQRTRDTVEQYLGASRGNPVAFATAAVAAGADLVVGHGPHVLRALQWRRGRLVAYSLGNLLTYGPFSFREPKNRGAVLCATLDSTGRVLAATLRPTRQRRPGLVAPDRSRRALTLVDSLGRLDFPRTGARVRRSGALRRPRS